MRNFRKSHANVFRAVNAFVRITLVLIIGGFFAGCASLQSGKDRERAKLHLQLATDRLSQREYNQALEAAQEALKADPEFPAAYNHIALIYMETKRYDRAEDAFLKALRLQADYPEALNNLGVLYNRMERFSDAKKRLEQATKSQNYQTPENAFTNLGYSYYRTGNLAKAKQMHEKALDISPMFCLASKNLGDVYAKQKNYKKAAEFFRRACTYCPLYQESQYKLGLVLMRLGQPNVARVEFEKLVERHKSGTFFDRSQEALKRLR